MLTCLTVTDLTRMQGQRVCVAGYTDADVCVRLDFPTGRLTESWLRIDAQQVIRPFSVVELDLLWPKPKPPHTEDWVVDPERRALRRLLPTAEREALLKRLADDSVESIFGAGIHTGPGWYVQTGEGQRSLGTIAPSLVREVTFFPNYSGTWDYRLAFDDQAGRSYCLMVTDLAFRYYLDCRRTRERLPHAAAAHQLTEALQKARVYLRIGLARGWVKYPGRCYLQITGVYSFPDYLGGRCFADF